MRWSNSLIEGGRWFQRRRDLDDVAMWPTSWALTKLTSADAARIAALVKKAVS